MALTTVLIAIGGLLLAGLVMFVVWFVRPHARENDKPPRGRSMALTWFQFWVSWVAIVIAVCCMLVWRKPTPRNRR